MPFGLKQTAESLGYCSEAWSRSWWKLVEDGEASGKTRKGLEGVRKVWERSGRLWERAEEVGRHGKITVHYMFKCCITFSHQLNPD